jgi:hypothetical protein
MFIIPATWEAEIGRIMVQGQPREKCSVTPIITLAKWIGGVAQVVGFLLCMYKALNSNPSHTK